MSEEQRKQLETAQQTLPDAQKRAEEAANRAYQARSQAAKARARLDGLTTHLNNSDPPRISSENSFVVRWLRNQREEGEDLSTSQHENAPDAWIEAYIAGREKSAPTPTSHHSAVRIELPVFSCRSLDWFCRIDLLYALVQNTPKPAGERLAILKERLRCTSAEELVYGLGGGELAYKETFSRLKQKCGRRDVMKAAHKSQSEV